jgi:DNA mismatch endonuclease (patch repair protein)
MPDIMTKEERRKRMSLIRGKWTKQEKLVHSYLKGMKIKHRMHPKMTGNPDILLKDNNVAVFLHGCFWHKCPKCYREPKTRKKYWATKIENNVKRHKINSRKLRKKGHKTIVLWEHEIKNSNISKVLERVK